jgi:hypothetical protein
MFDPRFSQDMTPDPFSPGSGNNEEKAAIESEEALKSYIREER